MSGHDRIRTSSLTALLAGAALLPLFGCSYVKQEVFDTEIARIRSQMDSLRNAHGELAGEVAEVDGKVAAVDTRVGVVEGDVQALRAALDALKRDFGVHLETMETVLRAHVPVYFAFDEATIRPEDRPVLDRIGSLIREYFPEALLTVEGFTDPAGTAAYNRRLGLRRAEAVSDYLSTTMKIGADRIRAVSYGETKDRLVLPGEWGRTGKGLLNRRVVIVIDRSKAVPEEVPMIEMEKSQS